MPTEPPPVPEFWRCCEILVLWGGNVAGAGIFFLQCSLPQEVCTKRMGPQKGDGTWKMSLNQAQGLTRGKMGLRAHTLMACFIRCDFPVPPHLSQGATGSGARATKC